MAVNKIQFGNEVLIDLSNDTVTEADVVTGITFHKKDGTVATGTRQTISVPVDPVDTPTDDGSIWVTTS